MAIPPIKTSANLDLSASGGADKSVKAHANINASAGAQKNQNPEAFQQVNQQLGRNNSQGNQNNQSAHGRAEGNQGQGNSAHASLQGNAQISLRGNNRNNGDNGNNGNHNGQHKHNASQAQGNQGNQGVQHGNQGAPQSNRNEVGDGGRRGNGNGNAYAYGRAEGRGNGNGNGQGNGNVQGNGNGGGNNRGGNPLNININFSANAQTGGNNRTGSNNQTSGNNQTNSNNQTNGNNQTNFNLQTNVNIQTGNNQATAHGQTNNHSSHGNGQGHAYGHENRSTQGGNGRGHGNAHASGHLNHSSHGHGNHSTQGQLNYSAQTNTQRNATILDLNLSLNLHRNGSGDNGNHNGLVRSVLNQVLRQNDIYLNQNVIRHFVHENIAKPGNGNHYGSRQNFPVPPQITQIVKTIRTQIIDVLNNPSVKFNGNVRVTIQNSPELASLIQGSKSVLLQNFGAKPFVNLNLQARMYIAAELILKYFSKFQPNVPLNHSAKQIFNGLLLARGFAITADKFFPRHDIFSAKKFPLPYNVPPVVIRNLGNAVKSLIVEARLAQTPKELEAAVEKFMRGLSGKNNLDALASAVKLAEQLGVKGSVEGEADVPEKIAELVKFLILAGDKALQSVADAFDAVEAELSTAQNADNSVTPEGSEPERDYGKIWSGDNSAEAESALRRQLEFNPFFQNERAASAFENPSEASRARDEFSNRFHNEIQQWLESGNHRFVKDIELEKPVGIVVERGTSGFFMADTVRFVLVRDGSVQGWHFLKSFLVR